MSAIFAYGTLQLPEVMLAVTGRIFPGQPARLENFIRKRLSGCPFPGIRPATGAGVSGIWFNGLNAGALKKLDAFEGDFYRRERRTVTLLNGAEKEAETYVLREEFHGLLVDEDWCLEAFRKRHLSDFLAGSF